MNPILAKITQIEKTSPDKIALVGSYEQITYQELKSFIGLVADLLLEFESSPIGLLMDNCPAWAIIDLAAQAIQKTLVPLPAFYSEQQLQYVIKDAGVRLVLTDNPKAMRARMLECIPFITIAETSVYVVLLNTELREILPDTAKITYTSGATGKPKGVCISQQSLLTVSQSLVDRAQANTNDVHLCLTPLSVLLENIAGVYTGILAGCTSCMPSLLELGTGSVTGFDLAAVVSWVRQYSVSSIVLMPQMLEQLVTACEQGEQLPNSLRFISVGGAPVSRRLLERAAACQLPVYQGYGLSECCSVVALNSAQDNRIGSVGKVLPHLDIDIAEDGEILLQGTVFNGYLNQNAFKSSFLSTGDLGRLDDEGYLYITGRKKNILITSYGRNISPEWLEGELLATGVINQACLLGDGKAWLGVIIHAAQAVSTRTLEAAVQQVNQTLPEYAQIKVWLWAEQGFNHSNQLLTTMGLPNRKAIKERYEQQLDALFLAKMECN